MHKSKSKGRKDLNQTAFVVVQQATGEVTPEKESAAQELGRRGGLKGGKARAEKLTAEQRSEIARNAAKKRWAAKKQHAGEGVRKTPKRHISA